MRDDFYISTMPRHFSMAQGFLLSGAALAFLGLILWAALPVRMALPPYLVTALLTLGYGLVCLRESRPAGKRKRRDPMA